MKRIKISKNELKSLYEKQGLTTYQIAEIYNCCQATIWKRLHEHDIEPRNPWNAIDLFKEDLEKWYIQEKLSTWEIERRYSFCRNTVYRKLLEYGIEPRSRAQSHIIYPRSDFNGDKADKAYLIGFAIGDLRVRKDSLNSETIKIDCGSTRKEQIELISKLFKPYGNVWVGEPNQKGAIQIECHLNMSFNFLLEKRGTIDSWILEDRKCFAAFLAGFTDAEGSIFVSNGQACYALGNYNKNILLQIRNRLLQMKIGCPAVIEDNTKGYIDKEGYIRKQNYCHLRVNKKSSLMNLFALLEPHLKHEQKIKDIKIAKQNIRLRNEKYGNINMCL